MSALHDNYKASRPHAKYFISRKARQSFYYFKEFPVKRFDKNMFTNSL